MFFSFNCCFVPEPWDTKDNVHHAGGAGTGAWDTERWADGEGETVGHLESNTGGGEEPGWAENQGDPEITGYGETNQVTTTYTVPHICQLLLLFWLCVQFVMQF